MAWVKEGASKAPAARRAKDPALEWAQSRTNFNADLAARTNPGPDDWQKTYFRGQHPSGEPGAPAGHRSKLRLKPFAG